MIGLMPLVSKVIIFGIDLFVRNRAKREALKANFQAFVDKFDKETKESGNLHRDYEEMRHGAVERISKNKRNEGGLD
jgi:hypothetical protein